MIEFHVPELADRVWAAPLLSRYGDDASEAAFGTYYMWQKRFDFEIALHKGFFVAHSNGGYIFPAGQGDLSEVLYDISVDAKKRGEAVRFLFSERFRPALEQFCPNCYEIAENRANADYLYRVSDLAALSGKKYHAKRNHIARFSRNYTYSFEKVTTEAQAQACIQLAEQWYIDNGKEGDISGELDAIHRAFEAYEALHLVAGMICVEDHAVAFAAGEAINDRVFDQHFEKALSAYDGAYAVINREFMANCLNAFEFVNREEDMGIEGLRKAKMSYLPERLVNKYTAQCLHP